MRRIGCLCLIILCLFQAESPLSGNTQKVCYSNVGLGPLNMRGQSPFQILRLSLTPESPTTLAKGHFNLLSVATWTNRWAQADNRYTVDMEVLRFSETIKYALTDKVVFGLEVPFCWRGGGIMDGLIEGFHSIFGLGQMGRTDFPRNRYLIETYPDEERRFNDNPGVGIEDIVLRAEYRLTCGTDILPATSVFGYVKLPTGNEHELYGTSGVDFGGSLALSKGITRDFYLYLNGGYFYYGRDRILGIALKTFQTSALLGLEYRVDSRWSVTAQYLFNTAATSELKDFNAPTHELIAGFKKAISDRYIFEFGLIENIIEFRNSADFGFHGGLNIRI